MQALKSRAVKRVELAFRPKTKRSYELLFRFILGFCICSKINFHCVSLQETMAYLEFLVENKVSANMLANNVSALKANFVMWGLDFNLWDHPRIKYFLKSVKVNRPLCPVCRNIMSLDMLVKSIRACDSLDSDFTYKAMFLMAFFGFLHISNLAPHSYLQFDASRHLTPSDIIFKKSTMMVSLKWSKTMQTRDKYIQLFCKNWVLPSCTQ